MDIGKDLIRAYIDIGKDLMKAYDKGYADCLAASKQEWISVEERLPNPTENVLVCKSFKGKPYIDIGYVKDANTCCCASDEYIIQPLFHKLTHWMPLPEPPKEGDK